TNQFNMLKLLVTLSLVTCLWASCYDKDGERNCKSWKDTSNFCNRPDADQYCAKTCGKCNGGGGGGSGNGGSCGRSFAPQGRVVNGKDAVPGAYPWMASIMMYGKHFCGATLVAPNWICIPLSS
uniref:ShKT domain-containing protein n=1 Tax=Clytia hemisphaerica TaxID=252671 RepID=A0A7M5V3D1_9CNID